MLLQIYTDLMFMKQALVYVLKDTSETDRLIEQSITALTNRCCIVNVDMDTNDTNTNDTNSNTTNSGFMVDNDMSMVHLLDDCGNNKHFGRSIGDGLQILNKTCVLFQR